MNQRKPVVKLFPLWDEKVKQACDCKNQGTDIADVLISNHIVSVVQLDVNCEIGKQKSGGKYKYTKTQEYIRENVFHFIELQTRSCISPSAQIYA